MARKLQRPLLLALAGTALGALACNAALGGGLVALAGGAGYLASQCYDRVRVKVRDAQTGLHTCEAEVSVSDGGSERPLRPCYNAALTEGRWQLTARLAGYVTASTEVQVEDHPGDCPYYTHSVELTLRPEGSPSVPTTVTPTTAPPRPAPPTAPAPPVPAAPVPEAPSVPTGTFAPLPVPAADAGAPRQ
jgi:hypothetical protein